MSVSIRDHAAAITAQLEADSVLSSCTFQGLVTDRPQRYCTFFLDSGYRFTDRLSGPDVSADFSITVHSVGVDPLQAQAVAERVFAQLLGVTLAVAGRRCSVIRHTSSQPTQLDDTITPPMFYSTDEFSFSSDPL